MVITSMSRANLIQSTMRTAPATDKPTIPIRVATPFKRTYVKASGSTNQSISTQYRLIVHMRSVT